MIVGKYSVNFCSSEKSTGPGESNFLNISPLNSLNLVLIPRAKLDGHRGTWTASENNIFNSNEKTSKQKRGTAIATKFVLPYSI